MHIPIRPARDYKVVCETSNGRESFIISALLDQEDEYGEYAALLYSCKNTASNIRIVFYEDYEEIYKVNGNKEHLLGVEFQVYNSRGERVY